MVPAGSSSTDSEPYSSGSVGAPVSSPSIGDESSNVGVDMLNSIAGDTDSVRLVFERLRADLDAIGLTPFDITLPGEQAPVAPLEGALRVRRTERDWVLETVDYGTGYRLLSVDSENAVPEMVLAYVSRPMPPPQPMTRDELDQLVNRVARHYFDLRDRARAAGSAGISLLLPPELPVDRLGALDGVELYPVETPFGQRAHGPWSRRPENDVHTFVTTTDIAVRAAIKPPWFGQPGGGLRYRLAARGTGIRDLVVSGALRRVQLVRERTPPVPVRHP